jgi:hypothetical protein
MMGLLVEGHCRRCVPREFADSRTISYMGRLNDDSTLGGPEADNVDAIGAGGMAQSVAAVNLAALRDLIVVLQSGTEVECRQHGWADPSRTRTLEGSQSLERYPFLPLQRRCHLSFRW